MTAVGYLYTSQLRLVIFPHPIVRIGSRIKKTLRQMDRLEEIAEDDRVDPGERAEFDSIVSQIRGLREAVDEMELYALTLQNKKRATACW